ncbi:MAG: sigma-54-dependent Fis family transcriptional regulator, partial [Planctomycetales bacterium]|nr:sigma-54-dependent Fis family transcriptional regulator [Planctomycetales bacterium]
NVRELRNVMERAIVLGNNPSIGVDDISLSSLAPQADLLQPTQSTPDSSALFEPITLSELEQIHITKMLEHTNGNKSKASQLLGIERSTLDRKLKRFEDSQA